MRFDSKIPEKWRRINVFLFLVQFKRKCEHLFIHSFCFGEIKKERASDLWLCFVFGGFISIRRLESTQRKTSQINAVSYVQALHMYRACSKTFFKWPCTLHLFRIHWNTCLYSRWFIHFTVSPMWTRMRMWIWKCLSIQRRMPASLACLLAWIARWNTLAYLEECMYCVVVTSISWPKWRHQHTFRLKWWCKANKYLDVSARAVFLFDSPSKPTSNIYLYDSLVCGLAFWIWYLS